MASYLGDQTAVRKKGDTKCAYHRKKKVIFICNDCTELICSTCSISTHKSHKVDELSDIVTEKKSALNEFINITEREKLPGLEAKVKNIDKKLKENTEQLNGNVTMFKQQGEKLKSEINIQVVKFTSLCYDRERQNRDLLFSFRNEIKEQYNRLDALVNECKQILQTGKAIQVYDFDLPGNDKEPSIPDLQTVEFSRCTSITDHIIKALGTVTTSNDPNQVAISRLDLSTQTQTKHTDLQRSGNQPASNILLYQPVELSQFAYKTTIKKLQPTPDSCCWCLDYDPNRIKLLNSKGQIVQELNYCDITDISLSPYTGHLWFCCYSDKTINEVLPTSESPVTRFEAYEPCSLYMTREDNVVVGTFEYIIVYTSDGTQLHTTDVWIHPMYISLCPITGNIAAVCNYYDYDENHIFVFDNKLNKKFRYGGEGIGDTFCPSSICYDTRGQIVMADSKRNTTDLISGTGQYIQTILYNKEGQGCIGIQTNGVLWAQVMSDTGDWEIKLFKYYEQ